MSDRDESIKAQVVELLRNSTRVDFNEIQVRVENARVTLSGAVDSAVEKRTARHLAEDVSGVEYVDDQMTVKNFIQRPDDELAEEVRHRLLRDAFTEEGKIEVYASNGEIRLDGTVPDYHTKKAAEDVAWWTPGVTNVENLLLVTEEDFVDVSPLEVTDSA